jgi:Putative Flp pilus-assembly TadE/G-like
LSASVVQTRFSRRGPPGDGAGYRHRGVVLILIVLLMVMFAAIASLAVDYGHVQLIKTQMQRTADATARGYMLYCATNGQSYATTHGPALYAAAANPIDANSGILPAVTVTWGYWTPASGTFSTSSGTDPAVKIKLKRTAAGNNAAPLFWGKVFGVTSIDVHATSVAFAPAGYSIVGLSSITYSSISSSDSYNSSNGSYASQTPASQGSIASNGTITVDSGSTVNGNVYYSGSAPSITANGGSCTGTQSSVSTITVATPSTPGSATSKGYIGISSSAANLTLTAGTYSCTGLSIDSGGTLTIDASGGPVNLYSSGGVFGNGGTIIVTGNIPNNFHLYVTNSSAVQLANGSNWYMALDAPLSTVTLASTSTLYGSVIANNLTLTAGTAIHVDQALTNTGSGNSGVNVMLGQ